MGYCVSNRVGFRIDGETEYTHLREFIKQTVHKDAHWSVEEFADIDDGDTIADAIRRGIAVGVSDGSFKDSFGTGACWIIQGRHLLVKSNVHAWYRDRDRHRAHIAASWQDCTA